MKMFFFFLFFAIIDIDEKYKRTFFAIYRLREKKNTKNKQAKKRKKIIVSPLSRCTNDNGGIRKLDYNFKSCNGAIR